MFLVYVILNLGFLIANKRDVERLLLCIFLLWLMLLCVTCHRLQVCKNRPYSRSFEGLPSDIHT